jgi:hypothetical protein
MLPESWLNRPKKAGTVSAEKRLCDLLGLPHPEALPDDEPAFYVGTMVPASSVDLVERFTGAWLEEKRALIKRQVAAGDWDDLQPDDLPVKPWGNMAGGGTAALLEFAYLFLTYRQYLHNVSKGVKPTETVESRSLGRVGHGEVQASKTPLWRPLDMRFLMLKGRFDAPTPAEWTPDLAGYLHYLRAVATGIADFLARPMPVMLPASSMLRHSYVTGAIGSGKTEMLKLLIHGLAGSGNCAVVVLDPHGDMAEQIARWPEFAPGGAWHGRLVYVDPFLDPGFSPCLNPFDLAGRKATVADSQQFVEALSEMLGTGGGSSFTVPMRNILLHTVPVLMGAEGRSPADLVRFLNQGENIDLVEDARRKLPPDEASFFSGEFQAGQYQQTRLAITTKLRVMLQAGRSLFVGPSTVNLEPLIEARKVVVFNLAKGRLGTETSAGLGRFILANILSLALRRAADKRTARTPAHVIVDECQNYLGPSVEQILTDARKFGVALTLCQQQVGQAMGTDLAKSVLGNPQLKVAGTNEAGSYRALAGALGVRLDMFMRLRDRQFVVARGGRNKPAPFVLDAAGHLADESRSMSAAEWEAVKAEQLAAYYLPIGGQPVALAGADGPDDPAQAPVGVPKPKYDLKRHD